MGYFGYSNRIMENFGDVDLLSNSGLAMIHCHLDILVEFSDKIGIRFIDLAEELESIVGFKVVLASKNGIKEKYFESIDSDLIYV